MKNIFQESKSWDPFRDRQRERPRFFCTGCGQEQYEYDRWDQGLCALCRRREKQREEDAMTLQEMSVDYWTQARTNHGRIQELRERCGQTGSPLDQEELRSRIRALNVLLRESRELADHLEHYYERGYCRNGKYTI